MELSSSFSKDSYISCATFCAMGSLWDKYSRIAFGTAGVAQKHTTIMHVGAAMMLLPIWMHQLIWTSPVCDPRRRSDLLHEGEQLCQLPGSGLLLLSRRGKVAGRSTWQKCNSGAPELALLVHLHYSSLPATSPHLIQPRLLSLPARNSSPSSRTIPQRLHPAWQADSAWIYDPAHL